MLAGTALPYDASDDARLRAAEASFYRNANTGDFLTTDNPAADFVIDAEAKPEFTVSNSAVSGTAYGKIENSLGAALLPTDMRVAAKARAEKQKSDPLSLLALNGSSKASIYVYGDASIKTDCPAQANSSSGAGIQLDGNRSSITTSKIGVTGSYQGNNISPEPITGTVPAADPYAALPVPEPGACLMTNARIRNDVLLHPGTYCGGVTIQAGVSVTLSPGIYIMKDGQFRAGSNSSVTGSDLLIALVGNDSYMYLDAGSNVKLTSPKDGTYKNIQFMSDRDLATSKFNQEWTTILSGAVLEYDGVMYLPEQQFWLSGTAHDVVVKAYSPDLAMLVDTAWVQGNAKLEIEQTDRRGIGASGYRTSFGYGARLAN